MVGHWGADRGVPLSDPAKERADVGNRIFGAQAGDTATDPLCSHGGGARHHYAALRRPAAIRYRARRLGIAHGSAAPWSGLMIESPLTMKTVMTLGSVPITAPVAATWGLMAALTLGGWLATRSLKLAPSRSQTVLELIVGAIEDQIRDTMGVAPKPYLPLIGTLFLFILAANWSSLIPGVEPPTARIETDAALAAIVFFAVIYHGIRARGPVGYLKTFAEPTFVMIPLNLVETFTRTFSLVVRLFGNVMSGAFIIGIILSLAGLIVPIPFMGIEMLIGAIQAYIFTVLAMVFIGSAINDGRPQEPRGESRQRTE